jgi:hypothetical protein
VRGRRAAASFALAAATLLLFAVSRGKWSDAIIDTGTEWIYADSLARGELLYRDVIYWFGPFTPYFQAAFLWALGSGFPALVAAGIAGSLATVVALYVLLRRVTGRRESLGWTALAVAALVFLPNAGGSILGMGYRIWHPATFTLLALWVTTGLPGAAPFRRAALAGLLCGMAALCRTEWGLIALAGVAIAGAVLDSRRWLRDAVTAGAVAVAGRDAVLRDGHVLLTGVSPETRQFLFRFSGVADWRRGLAQLFYSAAMWVGAVLAIEWLALGRARARRTAAFVAVGTVLVVSAVAGGASGAVLFSGAPLVCLAAIPTGFARRERPRGAALAAAGIVGLLGSHRRPFHIGDSAYVGPPLLFAFVAAAGLLHLLVALPRRSGPRRRLRAALAGGLWLLVAVAFVGRCAQYESDERVAIPGTGGMVSAEPRTAQEIVATAQTIRRITSPGDGLVVFPEGQIVNALANRTNPLRQKLYVPGYVTSENEASLIEELSRTKPRALAALDQRIRPGPFRRGLRPGGDALASRRVRPPAAAGPALTRADLLAPGWSQWRAGRRFARPAANVGSIRFPDSPDGHDRREMGYPSE